MSSSNSTPLWVEMCGRLAPIFSVLVFCAPIPTIRQCRETKNVGSLPLLPYTSMLSSAFLWVVYGILKQEAKIWSANGVGLILAIGYCWVFTRYCPKRAPTLPGSIQQHFQACAIIICSTIFITVSMDTPKAAQLIGNAGVVLCVFMFASPLAALKTVCETKSAKSIPLPFTVAAVINCFLWSVVGVLEMHDFNIYFPNVLGLAFGLIQVALKLVYSGGGEKIHHESEHSEPLIADKSVV